MRRAAVGRAILYMKNAIEARLDALQACVVALAATLPPDSIPLVRRLLAAAAADQEGIGADEDADVASAAVFAAVVGALPAEA